MRKAVTLAALLALGTPVFAEEYEWANKDHACIVEDAFWFLTDGAANGEWTDPPSTFFVKLTDCLDYAERTGLRPSVSPVTPHGINSEQWYVNYCSKWPASEEPYYYQVVEFDRLDIGRVEPIYDSELRRPNTSTGGRVFVFEGDGTIEMMRRASYRASENDRWFVFKAQCTVLER